MQTALFASDENDVNNRKIGSVDAFGFIFVQDKPMFQEPSLLRKAVDWCSIPTSSWESNVLKNPVGAMFLRISRNSERIIAVLSQHRKPAQVAWGIAIGMMLGLVPKDNLVAISLVAVLACLRVNQLAGCGMAIAMSVLGGWFSPITSYVGSCVLEQPLVFSGIVFLYRYPLLPWACLENSLVSGGIGIGLVTLLPTYAVCRRSFSKAEQQLESSALEQVANEAIQYRKSVADQSRSRKEKSSPSLKLLSEDKPGAMVVGEQPSVGSTSLALLAGSEAVDAKPSNPVAYQRMEHKSKQRTIPMIFTGEIMPDGHDTFLRETVIEVVRYRRPAKPAGGPSKNKLDTPALTQTQGISMPIGNASTIGTNESVTKGLPAMNKATPIEQSIAFDAGHTPSQTSNRDESLKYLLWHINGSRESVRKSSEKTA